MPDISSPAGGKDAPVLYIKTQDSSLLPNHVTLGKNLTGSALSLFSTGGRAYYSLRPANGPFPLGTSSTVKMGACSLALEFFNPHSAASSGGGPGAARLVAEGARVTPIPQGALHENCYFCLEGGEDANDPLINSFCRCAKPVHSTCLHRWITSRQTRECTICKDALPLAWLKHIVKPPFVVLRVVRHIRGLRWGGQREYIISFHSKASATMGCHRHYNAADMGLPDYSMARTHARLSHRGGKLYLEDLDTVSGTFVMLPQRTPFLLPLPASPDEELVYCFRVERTEVTLKLRQGGAHPPWDALSSMGRRFRCMLGGGSTSARGGEGSQPTGSAPAREPPLTLAERVGTLNSDAFATGSSGGGQPPAVAYAGGAPAAASAAGLVGEGGGETGAEEGDDEGEGEGGGGVELAGQTPWFSADGAAGTRDSAPYAGGGSSHLVFVGCNALLPVPPPRGNAIGATHELNGAILPHQP